MADTVYQLLVSPKVTQVLVQPKEIQFVRTLVQGPPGPSVVPSFIFNQGSAQSTWTIVHNLNKYPSVTILDSSHTVVEGMISYPDGNTVVAVFQAPFSGTAYLN